MPRLFATSPLLIVTSILFTACGGGGGSTQPTNGGNPDNNPSSVNYRLAMVEVHDVIDLDAEITELTQERNFNYNSLGNLTSVSFYVISEVYPAGRPALQIDYVYDSSNPQQTDFVTMDIYDAWWDGGTGELVEATIWDETWENGFLLSNTEEIQYFDNLGNLTNTQFNSLERFYNSSGNNDWIEVDIDDDGGIDTTEERTWSNGKLSTITVNNVLGGLIRTHEFLYTADGLRDVYTVTDEENDILEVYVYDFSNPLETFVLKATLENASFANPETDTVFTLHVLHYARTACGDYMEAMSEVIVEPDPRCISVPN